MGGLAREDGAPAVVVGKEVVRREEAWRWHSEIS